MYHILAIGKSQLYCLLLYCLVLSVYIRCFKLSDGRWISTCSWRKKDFCKTFWRISSYIITALFIDDVLSADAEWRQEYISSLPPATDALKAEVERYMSEYDRQVEEVEHVCLSIECMNCIKYLFIFGCFMGVTSYSFISCMQHLLFSCTLQCQ